MTTEKARMLAGEHYDPADPELSALRDRAELLAERFNTTTVADLTARRAVLEDLLGRLGDDAWIRAPFHCDYGFPTTIGDRTFVNFGAIILDCAPVSIGNDVQIATNVQLLTATHPLDAAQRRAGVEFAAPIAIGDGVWLGGGVIVCPGVRIGESTVVGAGAVVVHDLPSDVLAVGNPARIVRSL